MAELVDAADSKSVFERSGSSSLPRGTIIFLVNQGLRKGVERNFYTFFYPKNLPFSLRFSHFSFQIPNHVRWSGWVGPVVSFRPTMRTSDAAPLTGQDPLASSVESHRARSIRNTDPLPFHELLAAHRFRRAQYGHLMA